MKVSLTAPAKSDLRAIFDHYAEVDVALAYRMEAAILKRLTLLREFPLSGPLYELGRRPGVRRLVIEPFLVFYRVQNQSVEILHVRHGARHPKSLLD